jgi:nucleoside 2-deoxyribosyltransferase
LIYLAAPFFNEPQLELVRSIELLMADRGIRYFSPRKADGGEMTELRNLEDAKRLFEGNVINLQRASHVLAVMDWLMPEKQELRLIDTATGTPASGPIALPDTGVVWELGYAARMDLPCVLYTLRPRGEGRLNIMLGQAAVGVCHGEQELRNWLATGTARPWTGGHQ